MKYNLKPTKPFLKKFNKLIKGNLKLEKKIGECLNILRENPKENKLGSHKVDTSQFGQVWSIKITGDIRILWDYDRDNQLILLLLNIGGHDEVYR